MQNQMLVLRVTAAGLLIAGALFAVSPAAAGDAAVCTDSLRDDAIAACTRAIASRQHATESVAALYTSRGIAYEAKGQHSRANKDFDHAIRIDPQFARGKRTNPVAVGSGQFIFCCRAIVLDCRTKASWAIRNIQGNVNNRRCVETCSRNLKC